MVRVYYDTGDVLVTSERVAFESVSVPLADITGARVERVEVTQMVGYGRRPLVGWGLAVLPVAALLVGLFGLFQPAMQVSSPAKTKLLTGLTLAGAVSLPLVLLAMGRPVVTRRTVWWHTIQLIGRRQQTELYRTRDETWAATVVAAINQAVADAGRCPQPAN